MKARCCWRNQESLSLLVEFLNHPMCHLMQFAPRSTSFLSLLTPLQSRPKSSQEAEEKQGVFFLLQTSRNFRVLLKSCWAQSSKEKLLKKCLSNESSVFKMNTMSASCLTQKFVRRFSLSANQAALILKKPKRTILNRLSQNPWIISVQKRTVLIPFSFLPCL